MFDNLPTQPQDKILQVMQMYRADERESKIDLGVGVYKDAQGLTPIVRAIKEAEKRWWDTEDSKSYVGLLGTPDFADAMVSLVLGDAVARGRVAAGASPGGTGALRQLFELIEMASPDATVWVSSPSWPNHVAILNHMRLSNRYYRYFDPATGGVDFDGMQEDLKSAKPGDIILLHGCCHNPTGVNLTREQWETVTGLLNDGGLVPMVDLAYQGFGDGLEEDAHGTRLVAAMCPEVLIAVSCSKNFGIYRERTGVFMCVSNDAGQTARISGNLAHLNRLNFSFPPDHGSRLVTMVLNDAELRADWQNELDAMRIGMLDLRTRLAAELQRQTNSERFSFVADHRGMFSMLGLTPEQVTRLREDHAVYAIGDSRINIAGLNESTVPILARAVAAVL